MLRIHCHSKNGRFNYLLCGLCIFKEGDCRFAIVGFGLCNFELDLYCLGVVSRRLIRRKTLLSCRLSFYSPKCQLGLFRNSQICWIKLRFIRLGKAKLAILFMRNLSYLFLNIPVGVFYFNSCL